MNPAEIIEIQGWAQMETFILIKLKIKLEGATKHGKL
jgi:hypothetical protein